MEILKILDDLEAEIENSSKIPLTEKVLIKDEIIYEYIDLIREHLPEDLRESQLIKADKEKIISEAQEKADKILGEAKDEAENILTDAKYQVVELTDEAEVTRLVEEKTEKMLATARKQSEELILGSLEYSDSLLANLQLELEDNLDKIREGRRQLDEANKQAE